MLGVIDTREELGMSIDLGLFCTVECLVYEHGLDNLPYEYQQTFETNGLDYALPAIVDWKHRIEARKHVTIRICSITFDRSYMEA